LLLLVSLFSWLLVSQTAAPSPTPTACADPNRPIKVQWAKPAVYPPPALHLNLPDMTVGVLVTIDAKGNVEKATIWKGGSGNRQIDLAAIDSARGSTYLPKLVDCQPVESDGIYTAEFRMD